MVRVCARVRGLQKCCCVVVSQTDCCVAVVVPKAGALVAIDSKSRPWRSQPLPAHAGGPVGKEGNGARALGDPFNVLVWLANHLRERGEALPADSVVSTGTCTGLVSVAPGDVIEGRFAGIGSVGVTLTDFKQSDAKQ